MKKFAFTAEQENIRKQLGELFRTKREALNRYQTSIADELGVSQEFYCMIEHGKRNLDFIYVWRICKILHIPLSEVEQVLRAGEKG
jgi:transcriptional regulator with XRE-family HTH domain